MGCALRHPKKIQRNPVQKAPEPKMDLVTALYEANEIRNWIVELQQKISGLSGTQLLGDALFSAQTSLLAVPALIEKLEKD